MLAPSFTALNAAADIALQGSKNEKLLLLTALASVISVSANAAEKLIVAATPIPHAEILELIKPTLAKEGVDLQIKVFTDYVQPNGRSPRSA